MRDSRKALRPVIMGSRGMVSTGHPLASVEAANVLMQGGNAMDAALTAAGVLAVVKSYHCGLGGDVFALCYSAKDQRLYCVNGSGRSPYLVRRDLYNKGIPSLGILAASVPGAFDAWIQIAKKFATRSLKDLWKPAIEYATDGFPVFRHLAQVIESSAKRLGRDSSWAKVFLPGGKLPRVGELFVQRDLARTLTEICENKKDIFYSGWIADSICRTSEKRGGSFAQRDFGEHESEWTDAIRCFYKGYDVYVPPPNSYGLLLLLQLKLLANQDLKRFGHNTPECIDLQLRAKERAAVDGAPWIADPQLIKRKELEAFLQGYPDMNINRSLGQQAVTASGSDTTYIATSDERGNWVSLIQSVHQSFGCGVVVDGTGIVLNNRMSGFNLIPGHPNELGPHKLPAHTLSPVMVFKGTSPVLALGTPGGMGQTQFLAQILCNLIDFGMDVQQAIEACRWQSENPNSVEIEGRFSVKVKTYLKRKGLEITVVNPWEFRMGGAEGIWMDTETRIFHAGADPRRDGYAIGY